jgi:ribose-phosphate pyrophosphokinase
MTLHVPQAVGFFSVPVDHLNALRVLARHFRETDLNNTVVVSPDLGNAKPATQFARLLGVPVAAGTKQRVADDRVVIETIVGDVAGKNIIIMDDEIATAGSIVELLARLRERGAGRVSIACTHGLFTGPAIDRLRAQADITEIVTTNTVPLAAENRLPNLRTLSIAPLLAEAIRRIHDGESVSSLFTDAI